MNRNVRRGLHVMALVFAVAPLLLAADRARARPADVGEVLTGFSAKESCSCAFVVEQTDEYCRAFGQSAGFSVEVAIDHDARTVTSKFGGVSRTARFSDGAGCLTDALP